MSNNPADTSLHGDLRGSLRIRLLVGTLFWIAASVLVAGWGLGSLFRQHVAAQFHAELVTHLDQLAANLALDAQGRPVLTLPLSDPRLSRPYSGCYWQVDEIGASAEGDPMGSGLLRSRSLWDFVLAAPGDSPADGELHQHRITGPAGEALGLVERSVRIDEAPQGQQRVFRLIAAADERKMDEPVANFNGMLWLALGVLSSGLVAAALVQVLIGLAPFGKLREALARVRRGETQTLAGEYPTEVRPLIEDFNAVLTQNAEVLARARTQAGNLAHALKTPLSVLANAAEARNDDFSRRVIEQVDVARKQIDYHLTRAQAAAAFRLPGVRTVLAPVVNGLVRTMRRIHAGRELDLVVAPLPENLVFRGETQDLQELLGNLIDNACKWATRRVEIAARSEGGWLVVTIDDDGRGLEADYREAVLRRGVRTDEEVPGSGLGLAIVYDLAQLYGGAIELANSRLGGLRAVLTLPAAGSPQG